VQCTRLETVLKTDVVGACVSDKKLPTHDLSRSWMVIQRAVKLLVEKVAATMATGPRYQTISKLV